jgi:thioredoxin 1
MEVASSDFDKEVVHYKGLVLLEFWASWCLPCKTTEVTLKALKDHYKEKVKVLKMNIDRNPYYSKKYEVSGLPCFILMENGKEIERHIGSKSESELKEIIETHL